MGMFDDVRYIAPCPACKAEVTGWQSKDGPCDMSKLEPRDVKNFYARCRACGAWIEADVTVHVQLRVEPKT